MAFRSGTEICETQPQLKECRATVLLNISVFFVVLFTLAALTFCFAKDAVLESPYLRRQMTKINFSGYFFTPKPPSIKAKAVKEEQRSALKILTTPLTASAGKKRLDKPRAGARAAKTRASKASGEQAKEVAIEMSRVASASAGATSSASNGGQRNKKTTLKRGFKEYFDEASGKAYYFNSATGESTWEKPLGEGTDDTISSSDSDSSGEGTDSDDEDIVVVEDEEELFYDRNPMHKGKGR